MNDTTLTNLVSHGVLKKGLKKHLNPPFLYRLGGLKNSTTNKARAFLATILAFQQGLEWWVRIEESGTSPACALVYNRENKRGVIEALVVSSRSGPRYLSDSAPFFACL
jgi:hypothetical protein